MDKKKTEIKLFTSFATISSYSDTILEKIFHSAYKKLEKKFGCVYLSYVLESEYLNKNIQLATHQEWSEYYYKKGLASNCHIAKMCREMKPKSCSFTINWNLILPDDKESRKIHLLRRDFEFDNGVTYATILFNRYYGNYFELINIIGNSLDLNFYKEIYQNKNYIGLLLQNFRKKAYLDLSNTLLKIELGNNILPMRTHLPKAINNTANPIKNL